MSELPNNGHETVEDTDYTPDLLTLVDEDGVEHEFEIADVLELDQAAYMALIPALDEDELLEDSGELVVLKVVSDGEEEFLEPIEDEEEFNRISAMFVERLEDEYEFEDAGEQE